VISQAFSFSGQGEIHMKKLIKWLAIIGGSLLILLIAALLIIPLFVNIEDVKPQIENRVAQTTGRPFMLMGSLDLSLFPWAGFSMSDVHLGNLPNFTEKDFITVKDFEIRVKLLPLLFKDIQVKRFVIKQPCIVLVKNKNGRTNWEMVTTAEIGGFPEKKEEQQTPARKAPLEELPLKSLAVGEFAVTDGTLIWIDHESNVKKEISNLSLSLENVSLDRPIGLNLSALVDKWPLMLAGSIGPVGKNIGQGPIPVDVTLKAVEQVEMHLAGIIKEAIGNPQYDMTLKLAPFSPRKLLSALDSSFEIQTTDPGVLNRFSLETAIKGNTTAATLTGGHLQLDQTELSFTVTAREFTKPDVTFDLALNNMDLDRYLPPPAQKPDNEKDAKQKTARQGTQNTDYAPLRKIILDGRMKADALTINHAKIENLSLKVTAKNGVFHLDPLTMNLYQGHVATKGTVDIQQAAPQSQMVLQTNDIRVNPFLKDVVDKDMLEGVLNAQINMKTTGDDPANIKKTLNGSGDLLFKDGSIKGVDIGGMIQNVSAAFGLSENKEMTSRTDFSEFHVPFTIKNGIFNTTATTLTSPLLRLFAAGSADLVKETLDFRIEPKFVGTFKGQGDTQARTGVTVPVNVSGTFTSPTFRPDLANLIQQNLAGEIPSMTDLEKNLQNLKKAVPTEDAPKVLEEKAKKALEDKAKDLFRGFSPGK